MVLLVVNLDGLGQCDQFICLGTNDLYVMVYFP